MNVTLNRYPNIDNTITVYRDNHYCGTIFCPVDGVGRFWLANPWTADVAQATFETEETAVAYLVREG